MVALDILQEFHLNKADVYRAYLPARSYPSSKDWYVSAEGKVPLSLCDLQ